MKALLFNNMYPYEDNYQVVNVLSIKGDTATVTTGGANILHVNSNRLYNMPKLVPIEGDYELN